MSLLSTLLLLPPPAHACGGFFCDQQQPVLQAAERIVFGVGNPEGTVEMHVQITYEGASEDFAWIVPVPENPDLFLTTGALFTTLAQQTQPTFDLQRVFEGECKTANRNDGLTDGTVRAFSDASSSPVSTASTDYDVNVLQQAEIGPFETTVIEAAGVEDLVGWLQNHEYAIPDELSAVLKPYVAEGSAFVALRLLKDRDAGDLSPLAMRFDADMASVPVQLTSVAAAPDMRMEAYVLGQGRGVPDSYLHVHVNEAAIDWWTRGANYSDVITQAADEAGGHAFATDFFGPTSRWEGTFQPDYRRDAVVSQSNPTEWTFAALRSLPMTPPELAIVVEDHIGLPEGVTGAQFVACPDCWMPDRSFDPVAATDDLEVRVIDPMRAAQSLVDRHDQMARLTSSLDAVEMTVDPTFVINPDMTDEVPTAHVAELVYECNRQTFVSDALRRLELADGRSIVLPSESWFAANGISEFEYLQEHRQMAAQVIEQTTGQGEPSVMTDHTSDLLDLAEAHNRTVRQLFAGCGGCNGSSAPMLGGVASLGLLVLLAVRRRRA
ncbi:MAG: DUF2330 domain-containing protein [Myxococcales bacterium]|nr:DUF2330 domain-containing protein [Myxococcales bacterium]